MKKSTTTKNAAMMVATVSAFSVTCPEHAWTRVYTQEPRLVV